MEISELQQELNAFKESCPKTPLSAAKIACAQKILDSTPEILRCISEFDFERLAKLMQELNWFFDSELQKVRAATAAEFEHGEIIKQQ